MVKSVYDPISKYEIVDIENCKKTYKKHDDIKDAINAFVHADGYTHEYEKISEYLKIVVNDLYLYPTAAITMFYFSTLTWDLNIDSNLHRLRQSILDVYYNNYDKISSFSSLDECIRWVLSYRMARIFLARKIKRNLRCLKICH
jgi:hypothetical protein